MARMNYGPRFRPTIVSVSAAYDPAMDPATWGSRPFGYHKAGSLKACFSMGKAVASSKSSRKRVGKLPTGDKPEPERTRADYENAMLDRIKAAITLLEFGLEELNNAPRASRDHKVAVNRMKVVDIIRDLKCKCGVQL